MNYEVYEGLRKIRFDGELIAESSTEKQWKPRWLELRLYKVEPGQSFPEEGADRLRLPDGGYLLHQVGQSVLYHNPDNPDCQDGVPASFADLPEDAQPCPSCRPPGRIALQASPGQVVGLESTRNSVKRSPTAAGIVQLIEEGRPELSAPAEKLLRIAEKNDLGIRSVFRSEASLCYNERNRKGNRNEHQAAGRRDAGRAAGINPGRAARRFRALQDGSKRPVHLAGAAPARR